MSVVIDGSAGVTTNIGAVYNGLQSATAQASTSGTSIDFTSIPSWVKRITVMFNGVSLNGSSNLLIQIGFTSFLTSGYVAGTNATNNSGITSTSGYPITLAGAANFSYGTMQITNISGNIWVSNHQIQLTTTAVGVVGGGVATLSGTLDRVRITTVNGTDTFDAGSINIIYE